MKKRIVTATLLVVVMMISVFTTVNAQGGDDLGILDCYPPTAEYLQIVMPEGMPTFAFYDECGVINLQMAFTLTYPVDMVTAIGYGDMIFNVEPYPVLSMSWNDTNPDFLNLGYDTYPNGRHGLELVGTTDPKVVVGLIHTYYNPVDNHILMGEPLRLLYQNEGWSEGQFVYLTQEIGGWRTTAQLSLSSAQIVRAGLFQDADQVNVLTSRIQINLETIGDTIPAEEQTIMFVGCYESSGDWFGNRVIFSFELVDIKVEQIN